MILESMVMNAYYDIAGLVIMIALFVVCMYSKNYKTKSGRMLIGIILSGILATICDIAGVYPKTIGLYGLWIANILYFIFKFAILYLYAVYILTLVGLMDLIRNSKIWRLLFTVPIILIIILIVTSPATHLAFYFVDNGEYYVYTRGNLVFITYLIGVVYLVVGIYSLVRYKKLFTITEIISLATAYVICIFGLAIQLAYNDLIELFITSLALILIVATVEKNDSLIDPVTGLGSYQAFSNEVYRSYVLGNKVDIVIINIANFDSVLSILSIDKENEYVNSVATAINTKYRALNPTYEVYYADRGVFVLLFKENKASHDIAIKIIDASKLKNQFGFRPTVKACITSTKAFQSFDKFMQFASSFNYEDKSGERFIIVSNAMNDTKYQIMSNIDKITKDAITNDHITVSYQPVYSVKKQRFTCLEALARIDDPKYGIILPELFLSFSERSGRIVEIDKMVIEKVFQFITSDEFKALKLSDIEINVSNLSLKSDDFFNHLKRMKAMYHVNPANIIFETNDLIKLYGETLSKSAQRVFDMGFELAIDNYGIGYYNIKTFSRAPVSFVKVNSDLVKSLDPKTSESIVRNTYNLIHNLNREVTCSCVETEDEARLNIECGSNYVQGNYYSKPLTKDELIDFLKDNNE